MKRKKQLTPWRLGVVGLLMVVFFGLTKFFGSTPIKAITYDATSNDWCTSDLKTELNDTSTGFLSNLGSWATYVLNTPWTVGNDTNESASTCSSKIATFSYSEWNAIKRIYYTAVNEDEGYDFNYFVPGITSVWTRTPSTTAGYAYQVAASDGTLTTATVATDNSIFPGLYLDTAQICLTDFYEEDGSWSHPYPVVMGSNCDVAPIIMIDNAATAVTLNASSSAGLTVSGTATDYDGGQAITISATIAGTTKSTTINILATATVNWSLTWSLAELTNGIFTGNKVFTVTDSASKTGAANYTGTITVDKTAPSVAATSPAYSNDATLTLTDNLGVTYWAVTTSNTAPTMTADGTDVTNITSTGLGSWQPIIQSTSTSATFTPAATGIYYAWVKDVSGNTASATFSVTNGVFSGAATITGSLYVSASLTSSNTISPVGTYTYQWYRNSTSSTSGATAISGATSSNYILTTDDVSKYVYVVISAAETYYITETFTSNILGPINNLSTLILTPSSGYTRDGSTTTAIVSGTNYGVLSCVSSNTAAATCLIDGTTLTITGGGTSAMATITVTEANMNVQAIYTVINDVIAPTGMAVSCPGTYSDTGNYVVTQTGAIIDDGGSGINNDSKFFQVRTGALIDGVCNYGSNNFVNAGSAGSETLVQNPMPTGCYIYRYIVSDNAGNADTSATCQVLVDINAPSAPRVTITDDDGNELGTIEGGETTGNCNTTGITIYSASASANLNFSGSSDIETGVSGYAYATTAGGTKNEATSLAATATVAGTSYFVYAKDVAGNYSTCYTKVTVKLTTLTLTPNSGVSYVEGENLTATIGGSNYGTLSCQSSDASKATCSVDGTTLTITPVAEGTATITVTETNTNASTVYTAVVWDQPSCTISENPTNWTQSAVLTVSSNSSNLASAPFSWETATTGFSQTATKIITTNGTYTAWVKNDLGLTNSCEITVSNIDTTIPVVLATDDTIYTNQTPITTRIYNVNDVESGIASVNWNLWTGSTKLVDGATGSNTGLTYYKNFDFSSLAEGYYTATGTVTDQAGNAYVWNDDLGAIGIYYDTTAPIGGGITIETANINLNTNSVDLTVDDGADNLSGLNVTSRNLTTRTGILTEGICGEYSVWTNQNYTGTYPNLVLETNYTGDRCYQYRWSITDKAGNITNYTSEEIKVLAVIVPELTVTPPDASASAAQDIYVTATVATGSVTRIAYLWDSDLNASCNNGHTIVSGVNLKATQPDGSHVLNVCAISDTNGVATYSNTYGYSATPIIPTLQYQNSAANLYWNGVALNPLSENLTIVGAYAKTGKVYHYRLTLEIQDNGEPVTTDEVTVTTSTTGEVLFQFVIPMNELNSGKENSSLMGPQKVTITDLDTNESITFDYNVSFYFPAYQLDYEANAGNYIMMIGAGTANNIVTLQNFSAADCSAWPSVTGDDYSNAYGKKSDNLYLSAYYLRDDRDGKLYEVRKFSDGNCWLVDNLAYGGGTDGESDYCAAKTTMRAATTAEETTATITNGLNAVTGTPTLVGDCRNNPSNKDYGYLYNWAAAIQKTSGYDGFDYTPTQPVTGLCPTGWVLPTGGSTSDFSTLVAAVATDEFFLPGGNFKGIYAGMTEIGENIGNLTGQGTKQNYWSSTKNTASEAYALHIQSTEIKIQASNSANKQAGRAIRCVKKVN